MFGELRLNRAMTDEQIEIMRDPLRAPTAKLPRIEDAVKSGGFLTGSPDEIIEHLKKLEKAYPGLDRVSISPSLGVPKSVILEQVERFASEVMPAFKGKTLEVKAAGVGEVSIRVARFGLGAIGRRLVNPGMRTGAHRSFFGG